jgi:hypothetical protein
MPAQRKRGEEKVDVQMATQGGVSISEYCGLQGIVGLPRGKPTVAGRLVVKG